MQMESEDECLECRAVCEHSIGEFDNLDGAERCRNLSTSCDDNAAAESGRDSLEHVVTGSCCCHGAHAVRHARLVPWSLMPPSEHASSGVACRSGCQSSPGEHCWNDDRALCRC